MKIRLRLPHLRMLLSLRKPPAIWLLPTRLGRDGGCRHRATPAFYRHKRAPERNAHRDSDKAEPFKRQAEAQKHDGKDSTVVRYVDALDQAGEGHRDIKDSDSPSEYEFRPGGNIPFDNLVRPQSMQSAGSTMTRRERGTLKKLEEGIAPTQAGIPEPSTQSQRLLSSRPTSILDRLLDKAKARDQRSMQAPLPPSRLQKPSNQSEWESLVEKVKTQREEARDRQFEKLKTTLRKLNSAGSDLAVWNVLQEDVFKPVADMHLDDPVMMNKGQREVASGVSHLARRSTMRSVGNTFSGQLRKAATVLRSEFPTSPVLLNIIPELHRLGPTAFALGASTELYNDVLEQLAVQNQDLAGTVELLNEMDREVIEPNHRTLHIISTLKTFIKRVRQGAYGHAVRTVMATERNFATIREINTKTQELAVQLQSKTPGVEAREKLGGTNSKSNTAEGLGESQTRQA